ncbi:MAG: biotin--[acetyl-CoA-carboxylase] ligase [Patescibacteria group bacterium]|nr:biotin--[acetyl-CoA-carboxylase] ligase [Patescibacteria group bacterium]
MAKIVDGIGSNSYKPWNKDNVSALIKNKWFDTLPLFLESVESTNTYTKELCRNGSIHGTVVVAERQTQGRGRMQRNWFSPPGVGIWMSVLLIPPSSQSMPAALNYVATLSVIETINKINPVAGEIKWPNDVLIRDKKICGVLLEKCSDARRNDMVVVGIGINVNQTLSDFPPELQDTVTSLKIINGCEFSREETLVMILENIKKYYAMIRNDGIGAVYQQWLKHCSTPGKNVRIAMKSQSVYGIAERIDETGKLFLRTSDGQRLQIVAGDLEYEKA